MKKPILATCIDARKKYLEGLGDLSVFSQIIDLTEFVRERPEYSFRPKFQDRIPEVTFIDNREDIEKFWSDTRPDWIIFFAAQANYSLLYGIVSWMQRHQTRVDFALNRHTIRSVKINLLRKSVGTLKGFFRKKPQKVKVHTVYLPHSKAFGGWEKKIKYRHRKTVRHMDAPRFVRWDGNYGVFVDSYFPFHKEFGKEGSLKPKFFYDRLKRLLNILKDNHALDEVFIACHPNSLGEETELLKPWKTIYGKTNQYLAGAKVVWSFGSDASGIAVAYGKECVFVNFPDLLPISVQTYINRKSENLGIPVLACSDTQYTAPKISSFFDRRKQKKYEKYYATSAPNLSDVVRKTC